MSRGRADLPGDRPESRPLADQLAERTGPRNLLPQVFVLGLESFPECVDLRERPRARTLLDAVKGKFGLVPNMTRAMANSPAALDGYLQLSGALDKGDLSPKVREQIALAVAEANGCDYCLAAHSAVGKMAGLTAEQIQDSRRSTPVDPKTDALLRFARRVVDARGLVSDRDLDAVREAGFGDGAIAEMVANVALHVFTNYFNRLAGTDLDFPQAPALEPGSAMASGLQASADTNAKGPIMDVPTIVVRPGEGRSVLMKLGA